MDEILCSKENGNVLSSRDELEEISNEFQKLNSENFMNDNIFNKLFDIEWKKAKNNLLTSNLLLSEKDLEEIELTKSNELSSMFNQSEIDLMHQKKEKWLIQQKFGKKNILFDDTKLQSLNPTANKVINISETFLKQKYVRADAFNGFLFEYSKKKFDSKNEISLLKDISKYNTNACKLLTNKWIKTNKLTNYDQVAQECKNMDIVFKKHFFNDKLQKNFEEKFNTLVENYLPVQTNSSKKPEIRNVNEWELLVLKYLQQITHDIKHEIAKNVNYENFNFTKFDSIDEDTIDLVYDLSYLKSTQINEIMNEDQKNACKRIQNAAEDINKWSMMFRYDLWDLLRKDFDSDQISLKNKATSGLKNKENLDDDNNTNIEWNAQNNEIMQKALQTLKCLNDYYYDSDNKKFPDVKRLIEAFLTPKIQTLHKVLVFPQSILSQKLNDSKFMCDLFHEIWLSIVLERFNIFNISLFYVPTFFKEEKFRLYDDTFLFFDLLHYSKYVPSTFRAINYIFTSLIESRIPGIHRLLVRLNALYFFEVRINWLIYYNGGFNKLLKLHKVCTAIRYNIECIKTLWHYTLELPKIYDRGILCKRFFYSDLTTEIFKFLTLSNNNNNKSIKSEKKHEEIIALVKN